MRVVRVRLVGSAEPTVELEAQWYEVRGGDLVVHRENEIVATFAAGAWVYAVVLDDVPN